MVYIFMIAVSLALDAFAVSVSAGISVKNFSLRHGIKMGIYFGAFQFAMPLIGWMLGSTVAEYVSAVSPYISFGLLSFIGGRMVYEATRESCPVRVTELSHKQLIIYAVATSIDALAVGVTFAFMEINVFAACLVIGVVAFGLSVAGGFLGGKLGDKFQCRAQIFGGGVLIAIGLKMLIENFLG